MTKNYKNGYAKNKRVRFGSYFIVCFRGGVRLFQKPMGLLTRDTLLIVYGRSYICDIYLQFLCNYSNSTFLANTKLLSSRINILFIYIYY